MGNGVYHHMDGQSVQLTIFRLNEICKMVNVNMGMGLDMCICTCIIVVVYMHLKGLEIYLL